FISRPGLMEDNDAHCATACRARRAFSARRQVASRPAFLDLAPECVETMLGNRRAHARHHVLVIVEIDGAEQDLPEQLVAAHKMAKVGTREVARRRATA